MKGAKMISGNEIYNPTLNASSFLKIGQEPHLADLLNGDLYFNQLRYFNKFADPLRGDKFEGAIGCWDAKTLGLGIKNEKTGEEHFVQNLNSFYLHDNRVLDCHVFCAYTYSEPYRLGRFVYTGDFHRRFRAFQNLDERVMSLGDWVLEIRKPRTFISRVSEALKMRNLHAETGLVQFFNDKTYNGRFPHDKKGFLKPIGYDYQQEFRILVDGFPTGPQRLSVGSLRDICTLTKFSKEMFR